MPTLQELRGLWHRPLIIWPNGQRDSTTQVHWLQGPSMYADLRQPVGRRSFRATRGLRQLTLDQMTWMATQEGFAGRLSTDGAFFDWQRAVDFQPKAVFADSGRLWFQGDELIEEGRDIPYLETWRRQRLSPRPCAALRLRDRGNGVDAFVIRVGDRFMYARGRQLVPPAETPLGECIAGARSLRTAQDLVDCEVSVGRIGGRGWIIEHSTLPYKEGRDFLPNIVAGGSDLFCCADLTEDGMPTARVWSVVDGEGQTAALAASYIPAAEWAGAAGGAP
jgi:hypothetical protein